MKTIDEYLKDVAATTETGTDYAVAQALGLRTSHIANYRKGRTPDDNVCLLIAERLGIEPWEVIAAANAERMIRMAQRDQADKWAALWKRVRKATAVAIIAGLVVPVYGVDSKAYARSVAGQESLLYAASATRLHPPGAHVRLSIAAVLQSLGC